MKFLRRLPYWQLLAVPVMLWMLGAGSNQLVLIANHGKFPVMVNDVQIARMCPDAKDIDEKYKGIACTSDGKGGQYLDPVHTVMGANSHLKFLADIFDLGSIYSIGDFMLMLGEWLWSFTPYMWIALVIRKLYTQV